MGNNEIDEDVMPVFLINGFLEAGKTQFLEFTMDQEYFQTEGKTLLIVCEEGDTEYDEKKLKSLFFLINDGLLKTNSTKAIWGAINDLFSQRGIKYKAVNSHAKIFCCRIGENYITISGSGNWSENPRIENYILIGGKATFDFNKKWMLEQINY